MRTSVAWGALALMACTGEVEENLFEVEIAASGSEIEVAGARLEVPPGAFAADTTISVNCRDVTVNGFDVMSSVCLVDLLGNELLKPLALHLDAAGDIARAAAIVDHQQAKSHRPHLPSDGSTQIPVWHGGDYFLADAGLARDPSDDYCTTLRTLPVSYDETGRFALGAVYEDCSGFPVRADLATMEGAVTEQVDVEHVLAVVLDGSAVLSNGWDDELRNALGPAIGDLIDRGVRVAMVMVSDGEILEVQLPTRDLARVAPRVDDEQVPGRSSIGFSAAERGAEWVRQQVEAVSVGNGGALVRGHVLMITRERRDSFDTEIPDVSALYLGWSNLPDQETWQALQSVTGGEAMVATTKPQVAAQVEAWHRGMQRELMATVGVRGCVREGDDPTLIVGTADAPFIVPSDVDGSCLEEEDPLECSAECGQPGCGTCNEDVGMCDLVSGTCMTWCELDGACGEDVIAPNGVVNSCGDGENFATCDDQCVNLNNDPNYCGTCDMTCLPGASCSMGECVCPPGQLTCTDDDNDGSPASEDCDDNDPTRFPGAVEVCDGVDQSCSGFADDGDEDADGFLVCDDCDDSRDTVFPGAPELCDGLDTDCDASTDENTDGDADGQTACEGDCDDRSGVVYTGAMDLCDDLDNDCNGAIDDYDGDSDGIGACDGDCNDDDPTITGGYCSPMVSVTAGTFDMGSASTELGRQSDETSHSVTLSVDYSIGIYEVTEFEFESVMGYEPTPLSCPDCPIRSVTWSEGAKFMNELSVAAGLAACYTCTGTGLATSCTAPADPTACVGYRYPTEAEWEFAAAAGDGSNQYPSGGVLYLQNVPTSGYDDVWIGARNSWTGGWLSGMAWYAGTPVSGVVFPQAPRDVGGGVTNDYGLYDMAGNVAEWTGDLYGSYPTGPVTNPLGATTGVNRVIRGGSYGDIWSDMRTANRSNWLPTIRSSTIGLRVVISD